MMRAFWFRRLCQLLIILLFILLPWLNKTGFHAAGGSLFAFDLAGIPFADPASAAQAVLSGTLAWEPQLLEYLLGAILSLLAAFMLGRVFCGWICPYGFFSEISHNLRTRKNLPMLPRMQRTVWLSKCILVAIILALAAIFAMPLITFSAMPGQLSLLPISFWFNTGRNALFALAILPACALLLEIVAGKRLWCEFFCPQSVFLGLSSWSLPKSIPGLRIAWHAGKCNCGNKNPCANACTLNINPRHKNGPARNVCIMCGDCVKACEKHGGALSYTLKKS